LLEILNEAVLMNEVIKTVNQHDIDIPPIEHAEVPHILWHFFFIICISSFWQVWYWQIFIF
jgi:hypothetical protein